MSKATTYSQLIRLPNVLALLASICLSRLATRMFIVVIVFHTLAAFASPVLAGWIVFAASVPGLVVSPLAGALLDRAGAARGVIADLLFSTLLLAILAAAIACDAASPQVLLALVTLYSLTNPLSIAGVRVLLPRLVPVEGRDRANALDTMMHAVVDVTGAPVAGVLIGFAGSPPAFLAVAAVYAAAALCAMRLRDDGGSSQGARSHLLREAWHGLSYVARTPLLRGLAVGYALNNFVWGVLVVVVPVVTARYFAAGAWQSVSGLLWAGVGVTTGMGALAAGRVRVYGREIKFMVPCMLATSLAVWPIAALGMAGLAIGMALAGLLTGPIDIGVLSLRQRRVDPGVLGRVLAVSISANTTGFPIGTAVGGILVVWSTQAALLAAALASLLSAAAVGWLIPPED